MGDVTQFTDLHGGAVFDDGFGGIWPTRAGAERANEVKQDSEKTIAQRRERKRRAGAATEQDEAWVEGARKEKRKKCNADLVRDARKLHDRIGRTLDPVAGKPLQFHKAYAAFALVLLDLLEDVRQERPI